MWSGYPVDRYGTEQKIRGQKQKPNAKVRGEPTACQRCTFVFWRSTAQRKTLFNRLKSKETMLGGFDRWKRWRSRRIFQAFRGTNSNTACGKRVSHWDKGLKDLKHPWMKTENNWTSTGWRLLENVQILYLWKLISSLLQIIWAWKEESAEFTLTSSEREMKREGVRKQVKLEEFWNITKEN